MRAERLNGAASNRVCAKIAASVNKPDGLVVIRPGAEREFLDPLPVEAVPGIGPRTPPHLHTHGIRTVREAVTYVERNTHAAGQYPPLREERLRTFSLCSFIASCALPSDEAILPHDHVEKSISRDRTFGTDTADSERVSATLYTLAERCCKALRQDELLASTVTVRVRFTDFTTVQKQCTLRRPSSNEEDVFAGARRLLAVLSSPGQLVRLVGVKVSILGAEGAQLDLDAAVPEKFGTLHRRLNGLQTRYGYDSIRWGITWNAAERREERE